MSRARVRGHHGRHGSRERPLTGHGPGVGRAARQRRQAVGKVPQPASGMQSGKSLNWQSGMSPNWLTDWALAASRWFYEGGKQSGKSLNWQAV